MLCYSMSKNNAKKVAAASRRKRNYLWRLSERQNHRCCYCGQDTWVGDVGDPPKGMSHWDQATKEHVIAKKYGGTGRLENIVMACSFCNGARGSGDAYEFYEYIKDEKSYHRRKRIRKIRKELAIKSAKKRNDRRKKSIVALIVIWRYYPREMSNLLDTFQKNNPKNSDYWLIKSLFSMDDTLPRGLSNAYNEMCNSEELDRLVLCAML